jgi:UDPglucose--hexose-1-phosphate uridylyltransferase
MRLPLRRYSTYRRLCTFAVARRAASPRLPTFGTRCAPAPLSARSSRLRQLMPEIRIDPISGARSIVAGERSARPGGEPRCTPPEPIDRDRDPFADGAESSTPPELFALRPEGSAPDTPGWQVRVVPNLFPALLPPEQEVDSRRDAPRSAEDPAVPVALEALRVPPAKGPLSSVEMFSSVPAVGAHEVIVNGPQQVLSLAQLPVDQVYAAMEVWRLRMRANAHRSSYVQLIVNERREAGASLPHTHAQLYGLPFVPADVARERERFGAHAVRTMGQNLLGDVVQEEVRIGDRIVGIDGEAVLIAPFASKLPYQLMLVPRRPRPRFEEDGPLGAALLHDGLARLSRLLGASPPLNLWVRTAPYGADHFCWRIDVMPRLTHLAGLELSTGLSLNIVAPEDAAARLREV